MRFALRFFCYVLGIGLALDAFFGPCIQALLPLFKGLLTLIDSHFEVISAQVVQVGDAQVIDFEVRLAKAFWLGKHFIAVDPSGVAHASTTLMHLWQSLAVCLALILSWPGIRMHKRLLALAYGLLGTLLVWCIDVPFVLLAALWQMIYAHYAIPDFSMLTDWQQVLENGGRLILGLMVGCLAIFLT
ncbi:hypothetical protein [Methylophilus sp. 3sh_L]|uniref:hypothetical protein n=1 Tax=Methylophilus sp. 3sh_L TaxID=3377114 RepID=UPI00398E784C